MKKIIIILQLIILLLPFSVFGKTPNDPFYSQWAYNDIGVYGAWDYTIGSNNVVVAIIDNGFDSSHPDLKNNVWKNTDEKPGNKIDDDKNGYVDDVWGWNFMPQDLNEDGFLDDEEKKGNNNPVTDVKNLTQNEKENEIYNHATIVAGLIGAVGNNKKDGVGLNWKTKLINLKVVGNSGEGNMDNLPPAIFYAVDNGAKIINISMVGNSNESLESAIKYAYEHQVVVVAAAGNNMYDLNSFPMYPVCSDKNIGLPVVLGVSGIDEKHHIAMFSNVGSNCIDLTAPGVNISSSIIYSPQNGLNNSYERGWKGTSFSAPLVSGTAALIKSLQPNWGPKEIFNAILSTTQHTPGQDEKIYADYFGAGLLQANKAVKYAYEKIVMSKPLSEISFFLPQENKMIVNNLLKNIEKKFNRSVLNEVNKVFKYDNAGIINYITVKYQNKANEVVIYDSKWKRIRGWKINAQGPFDLLVGDFLNDEQPEIILAPQYENKIIYRVYNFQGKEIKKSSLEGDSNHKGVKLSTAFNIEAGKRDIVAAYQLGEKHFLKYFFSNFSQEYEISNMKKMLGFGAGDLNNDKNNEYVYLSLEDDKPIVQIFDNKMSEIKKLYLCGEKKCELPGDLFVADYDRDNIDDIIIVPQNTEGELQVLDYSFQQKFLWKTKSGVKKSVLGLIRN